MDNANEKKTLFEGVNVTIRLDELTDLVRELAVTKSELSEADKKYWSLYTDHKKTLEENATLRSSVLSQAATLVEVTEKIVDLAPREASAP